MLPGPLQVGDLLAGRYRLLDPVATDGPAVLWRAQDEVLARDVAVRVLPTPDRASKTQVEPFLVAAARAGKVTHSGLVRVYDAAQEPGPRRAADVAFLIREWVVGEPLDEHLLRVGELASPDAADLLRQVAEALSAAHAAGLAHGRVHPGNVLVTPAGRVRLTDAAVAAAVHGQPVPDQADARAIRADTRDAGAVLYALLTAHWPAGSTPQPAGRLPLSPLSHGRALAPHQVRAGVPRQLDHVVLRALDPAQVPTLPPLAAPAALADATDACAEEARHARQAALAVREPTWARRHLGWLLAAALVMLFGAVGWFSGLAIGELPRQPDAVDALASPRPTPSGASPAPRIPLQRVSIRDFDPLGDGQENPDQVRNATDLDPTTAWVTQRYRSAAFSGLKPGVGLLLDLGRRQEVHRVEVALTARGAHLELRVADTLPATLSDTLLVAQDDSERQLITLAATTGLRARFVLVWVTELPKDEDGYRVGIAEVSAG
ncbi:MAG TPA: protein kinase [Mycobacteriales bacterium]|nr:protein kinase [Mycobacteriales bacterium]